MYSPYEKQLSIVLIGHFNPKIFHPQWFADHEIISNADLRYIIENRDVLTHKQLSQFSSSWFILEVTESRLHLTTTQEAYFEMLLDFISATFSILHHTPISMLGINLTINQSFTRKEHIEAFEGKYLHLDGFSQIDNEAEPVKVKIRFTTSTVRLGNTCNFELTKIAKGDYSMNINQHFNMSNNTNGKEFVNLIGKFGRESILVNDLVLRKIIENKD